MPLNESRYHLTRSLAVGCLLQLSTCRLTRGWGWPTGRQQQGSSGHSFSAHPAWQPPRHPSTEPGWGRHSAGSAGLCAADGQVSSRLHGEGPRPTREDGGSADDCRAEHSTCRADRGRGSAQAMASRAHRHSLYVSQRFDTFMGAHRAAAGRRPQPAAAGRRPPPPALPRACCGGSRRTSPLQQEDRCGSAWCIGSDGSGPLFAACCRTGAGAAAAERPGTTWLPGPWIAEHLTRP